MVGVITTILAYALLFSGVYKLFTIANDLTEIKQLLRDLARDRNAAPQAPEGVLRE